MSDSIPTTRPRRPWACLKGHHHRTQRAAVMCVAETIVRRFDRPAWVPSAERIRAIFRPIPGDQRDPMEARVERGRINWGAVWRGFVVPALGALAALGAIVAVVSLEGALQYAVVQLVFSGHDIYLLAALAAVVLVGVSIPIVRRPRVRRALAWLKEMYS